MAFTPADVTNTDTAGHRRSGERAAAGVRRPVTTWHVEVALVALVALVVRLIQIDHAPWLDELFHMLAARSLLEDGTLYINGTAEYTRARLFTWLIAGLTRVFGESLVVARLPAVVAGTALVTGLFLWLRRISGRPAAWTAALLLCFSPISIYLSQQARFYILHALLFGAGALAVYHGASRQASRRRVRLFLVAALCFTLALWLQITTVIGMLAVGLWLLVDRTPEMMGWLRANATRRLPLIATASLALLALLALAGVRFIPAAVDLFTYADSWAEANRDYARYYHDLLLSQYPTLWSLLPVAFLIAVTRHTRLAFFLATLFGGVFLLHSAAAWKHERYIFYVLPAFFALWGIAIGVALPWLHARLVSMLQPHVRVPHAASAVFLGAALLFTAASNRATIIAWRVITVDDADWTMPTAYRGEADWQRSVPVMAPAVAEADVVLASSMLKALFFLERLDLGISVNELGRLDHREFAVATREGVPVISRVESLTRVHGCYTDGLVIVEERDWARPWKVPEDLAAYIEQNMQRLATPSGGGLRVYRWDDGGQAGSGGCPELHELVRSAGRRARAEARAGGGR